MTAVRCRTCFWSGNRKTDAPLNAELPKPCPNGHEVVVGPWPPTTVQHTPKGIEIAFWDTENIESGEKQQRRYKVNGDRFTSVSTITGMIDKSDFLVPWAVKLALAGEDWRDVRDKAAERGNAAHEIALDVVLGKPRRLSSMEPEHRPYGQAAMLWVSTVRPKLIQSELMVASVEHGYSGRFDLLAEIDGFTVRCDYKSVTDWKYDKQGKLYPPYDSHALQLDLYEGAAIESGYPPADYGMIVRLGPDGDYVETPFKLDPDRGVRLLNGYRAKGEAGKALADEYHPSVAPMSVAA